MGLIIADTLDLVVSHSVLDEEISFADKWQRNLASLAFVRYLASCIARRTG